MSSPDDEAVASGASSQQEFPSIIHVESYVANIPTEVSSWSANTVRHTVLRQRRWWHPLTVINDLVAKLFRIRLQRVTPKVYLCNEYENEEHHRGYGGPWCRGRDHFNSLIREGLQPDDSVLDLGCGSLRVGIWLVQYLNPGRYYGVDSHYPSLEVAASYEVPLHGLSDKRPRLLHSPSFELDHFKSKFDLVVAVAVFCHLTTEEQVAAIKGIVRTASPRMRLFIYQPGDIDPEVIRGVGLELDRVVEHTNELFSQSSTKWFIYKLS